LSAAIRSFIVNEERESRHQEARNRLISQIGAKEERKLKARRKGMRSVWSGLGVSGMIGWSVAIPTLIGTLLGVWVDSHYPSRYSWTLMLLVIGLAAGCLNAWQWVKREERQMHEGEKDE